jgi:hypothetical protein
MQPYRSDLDALEARHAALEAEVAERVRQRDDAARMLAEARAQQRNAEIAADYASGGPARRKRLAVSIAIGALVFAGMVAALARIKARPSYEERMDRVMAQFEQFTNDMCECKDKACAQLVSDQMQKWASDLSKDMPPAEKYDEGTMKRAAALGDRMGKCMSKAMMSEEPMQPYGTQQGGVNGRGNSNDTVELERAD